MSPATPHGGPLEGLPEEPEGPPGGAQRPDQALAGALLPVLLHRIRNTTQLVTGVNAVLALEEDGPLPAVRAEDLAQASREADELGWLLAVLSGDLGADLAGARREPGGLRATLELVRDALRRAGGAPAFPDAGWPLLAGGPRPAALCLTAAELVWRTGLGAERAELGVERGAQGWLLWMRCARIGRLGLPAAGAAQRLPESRLAVGEADWALQLPADWLAPAPA